MRFKNMAVEICRPIVSSDTMVCAFTKHRIGIYGAMMVDFSQLKRNNPSMFERLNELAASCTDKQTIRMYVTGEIMMRHSATAWEQAEYGYILEVEDVQTDMFIGQ